MTYKALALKKSIMLLILFIGTIISFSFQKAPDGSTIDVANYKGKKVIVGTEGGVVSMRNETIILYSGQVFYHNSVINEYKYLKTLPAKKTKQVFKLIKSPRLPHKQFNHPGNMSTFLEYYKRQKLVKSYIWGEPGIDVPPALDKTYSEIINILK
jgi:hypothetical protein